MRIPWRVPLWTIETLENTLAKTNDQNVHVPFPSFEWSCDWLDHGWSWSRGDNWNVCGGVGVLAARHKINDESDAIRGADDEHETPDESSASEIACFHFRTRRK